MNFVRYQEKTEIRDDLWVLVVDKLFDYDYFVSKFLDKVIAEDLISTPKRWDDNGEDCVTGTILQHRVLGVYDDEEDDRSKMESKLHKTPSRKELKSFYEFHQKFHFYDEV